MAERRRSLVVGLTCGRVVPTLFHNADPIDGIEGSTLDSCEVDNDWESQSQLFIGSRSSAFTSTSHSEIRAMSTVLGGHAKPAIGGHLKTGQ